MRGYLPQVVCVLSLLLGLSVGWYFGYTRPSIRMQQLHDEVKAQTGMSEKEMVRAVPEALAGIKREDESVALVGLKAIGMLDRGETEKAKGYLAYWVGSYYRVYHESGGDTNLIAQIKTSAATNAFIAKEIAKGATK
jgi:hypothetical protein